MSLVKMSTKTAKNLLLEAQGMLHVPERPAVKSDVLQAVRRMGALQIDTISVVARSPYLVLWSRLGDYEPAWLEELQAEGALFEYWSHAACFLPSSKSFKSRATICFGKSIPSGDVVLAFMIHTLAKMA